MENVVIPALANSVEGIVSCIRHARNSVLPAATPPPLRKRYSESPLFPFWPVGDILNEIKQFFQGKEKKRFVFGGRGRWGYKRSFRARGRRGFAFGGTRRVGYGNRADNTRSSDQNRKH